MLLTHSGVPLVMFLFLLLVALGSVLASFGARWAPAMIAPAAIPASAAYLIPASSLRRPLEVGGLMQAAHACGSMTRSG